MTKYKKIITGGILSLMIFGFLHSTTYSAVDIPTPDGAGTSESNPLIKCDGSVGKECGYSDLIKLVQNGLNLTFAFAAFIAVGMFMYAGFLYLTSVGNTSQIQKAHGIFRKVVIGFLIMFMAFLLVQELLRRLDLNDDARKVIEKVVDIPGKNNN